MADLIDLVDKKKLIRNIHQILDKHINASADYPAELFEIKHELLGSIDIEQSFFTQDSVNRWIACRERLPENRERVLVRFRSGTVHIAVWYGDYDEKGAWKVTSQFPTKLYRTDTIPKWMPMPDAYESPEEGADDA